MSFLITLTKSYNMTRNDAYRLIIHKPTWYKRVCTTKNGFVLAVLAIILLLSTYHQYIYISKYHQNVRFHETQTGIYEINSNLFKTHSSVNKSNVSNVIESQSRVHEINMSDVVERLNNHLRAIQLQRICEDLSSDVEGMR